MDASGRKIEAGRLWRAAQRLCDEDEHIVWAGRPGGSTLVAVFLPLALLCGLLGFVFAQLLGGSSGAPDSAGGDIGDKILAGLLLALFIIAVSGLADYAHRLHVITNKGAFDLHWWPMERFTREQVLLTDVRFVQRSERTNGIGTLILRCESGESVHKWKRIGPVAEVERLYRQTFKCEYDEPEARQASPSPALDLGLLNQPILVAELRPGEQVLWIGKPVEFDFFLDEHAVGSGFAGFFCFAGLFFTITAVVSLASDQPQAAFGMLAIGVGFLGFGSWFLPDYWRAKRSILDWRYVITDRRAILFEMHPNHRAVIWSFRPERVRNARIEPGRESNSLVFLSLPQVSGKGRPLDPKPIGFIAVSGFESMLAVITEAFGPLHSMKDEPAEAAEPENARQST